MNKEDRNMRILMVCLGNICRSPMAEGVLRDLAAKEELDLRTDSAGTSHFHIGEAPDHRATAAMAQHGIDITDLRARQVSAADFARFDLLLAMDESNLADLKALAPDAESAAKAKLIMDFAPEHPVRSVPDPYYGGDDGFEQVFEMLNDACMRMVQRMK